MGFKKKVFPHWGQTFSTSGLRRFSAARLSISGSRSREAHDLEQYFVVDFPFAYVINIFLQYKHCLSANFLRFGIAFLLCEYWVIWSANNPCRLNQFIWRGIFYGVQHLSVFGLVGHMVE